MSNSKMSAEEFIKYHFENIDKKTEWFAAMVAIAEAYAKYLNPNQ